MNKYHESNRATYEWDRDGHVLWLKDKSGLDDRSLTNDIENALTEIAGMLRLTGETLRNYQILYQDSDGVWDAVIVTFLGDEKRLETALFHLEREGHFASHYVRVSFFPIRKCEYREARAVLRLRLQTTMP